jgi:hypothetical protein
MMSGGESRQSPLPKGQFRDRAESERQRKTHSPRMVTYILNRPLHAHTMHIFSRQDCIPLHTPLSGGYLSHCMISITRHNTGSALAVPNSSYSRVISFTYDASDTLSHHSNGTGGAYWMTSLKQAGETRIYMGGQHAQGPHKIIQLATLLPNGWRAVKAFAMRSQWASHPSNRTGGTAHWICTGMVRQETKPTGQDSTPLSLAVLKQLRESHMGGHRQDPHKIITGFPPPKQECEGGQLDRSTIDSSKMALLPWNQCAQHPAMSITAGAQEGLCPRISHCI